MTFIEVVQCDVLSPRSWPTRRRFFPVNSDKIALVWLSPSLPIFHPKTLLQQAELTDCLVIASLDYTVDIDQAERGPSLPPSLLAVATISAVISREF